MSEKIGSLEEYAQGAYAASLLREVHAESPFPGGGRRAREGELSFECVRLVVDFDDPEGLLDTSYSDFRKFLDVAGIKEGDGIPIYIRHSHSECFEAYTVEVTECDVTLSAMDTEGIRRALVYIEDEMARRGGAVLALGCVSRHPFIKRRITRCPLTPPSHASGEGLVNELLSEVDYYPDEYLCRLMHDGVNALWIGANFRDLAPSSIIGEYGENSEKMLNKLSRVVKKCKRYGIGIYIFSVEPASGYLNPAFNKHTELHGGVGYDGIRLFCPSLDATREYIREAVSVIFGAVPELLGFIGITVGECLSGCGSSVEFNCPRCKKKFGSHAATLAATERMIADAIKEVSPDKEFISWTYAQRSWRRDSLAESLRLRDRSVLHMQNFEDYGRPVQLGRKRLATDYWLSYVGPGEIMAESLAVNKERGIRTYAKIQACSSHEISTVPYVPVPGILYDKYKVMHEDGVSGVLQSWYFGNYPCMMNKAACELSFEPFPKSKGEFLRSLAGIYWGEESDAAVSAYEKFEAGYREFPVSVSFEWFGPMQDSPAVDLHLKPVDLPMSSTWLTSDPSGGDRIGEALTDGHTLAEACILTERTYLGFKEGEGILSGIDELGLYSRREAKSVAKAISLIFESGHNRLRFYEKRHALGLGDGDPAKLLADMRTIVEREIAISTELIPVLKADARIGYHSEAHGHKLTPELLRARIESLHKLLDSEFCEVEERIRQGLVPLKFYTGRVKGATRVMINGDFVPFVEGGESSWTAVHAGESEGIISVKIAMRDGIGDTVIIRPEWHLGHPSAPMTLAEGRLSIPDNNSYSFIDEIARERRSAISCEYSESGNGECSYTLRFARPSLTMTEGEPFRMDIRRQGKHSEVLSPTGEIYTRLIQGRYSPSSYAFFVVK